jgi:hypothetical protein
MNIRKLGLSLISAGLLLSLVTPALKAEQQPWEWSMPHAFGIIAAASVAVPLIGAAQLHFKSRTPKPELPKEGSILSYIWYLWNEKFVGVIKTKERIKETKPDPEHPEVTKYSYEKIEGRGLLGIGSEYTKGILVAAALFFIAKDFVKVAPIVIGKDINKKDVTVTRLLPSDLFGCILRALGFGKWHEVPVVVPGTTPEPLGG